MAYQLPDSRMEMPELLTPRRKPVGNVQIDWDHPLTKGLRGLWLNGGFVNLVTGTRPALVWNEPNGTQFIRNDLVVDGAVVPAYGSGLDVGLCGQYNNTGELSGVVIVKLDADITSQQLCTSDNYVSDNLRSWQFRIQNSKVNFIPFVGGVNGDLNGDTDVLVTDGFVTAGFSHKNDTVDNVTVYRNGLLDGTATTAGALDNDNSSVGIGVGLGKQDTTWYGNLYGGTVGTISYCGLWNRPLTEVDHRSLHCDPYQFLIPV